jgi:hypothetical protein
VRKLEPHGVAEEGYSLSWRQVRLREALGALVARDARHDDAEQGHAAEAAGGRAGAGSRLHGVECSAPAMPAMRLRVCPT